MSQKEKLIAKARRAPEGLRYSELVKLANLFGFIQVRQAGSHCIFSRGPGYRKFNFQDFHGMAKPFQVKQFLGYLEELKWL